MRRAFALSALVLCGGCDQSPKKLPDSLVFVSTITGKVAILDSATLDTLLLIIGGHTASLGVAVAPGQRAYYYGNRDTGTLDRIELSANLDSSTVAKKTPVNGPIKGVSGARDGSVLAVTSDSVELPFD